jgi:hypothetical protein
MADLTITPANIVPGAGARITNGTAGATVTAGQVVYLDPADNRFKLADCDNASATIRAAFGIATHGASNGQPLAVQTSGDLAMGTILAAGVTYYLSPNAGGIAPIADILSGDNTVIVGMAKSTSVLSVGIVASGAALA